MKKIYELPFLEINQFEIHNSVMAENFLSNGGYDDGEIEEN